MFFNEFCLENFETNADIFFDTGYALYFKMLKSDVIVIFLLDLVNDNLLRDEVRLRLVSLKFEKLSPTTSYLNWFGTV
jgi:hypothetical protein